ncbi:DUF6670 family protein [Acinetobacter guerrae]|uniref:DUF6670 family protein n=1 Tax=Acinetobacter guerrae TaxID=1843371 RepID=UPI00128E73C4|nr:DUF6670 family protein [Acinetobacter guerrae]MPW44767.1 hypothetical protein [Acinetobacter guerrae]
MNLFSLPKLSPRAEILAKTLHHLTPLVDQSNIFSRQIFQLETIIQPYFEHHFYSCSRYAFNFPELITPFHYLNISAVLGTTGLLCFDQDELQRGTARNNATVFMSTALKNTGFLKGYTLDSEEVIHIKDKILFGRELLIEGVYPEFRLKGDYSGIQFNVLINLSRQASWMIKTPLCDHFSLMMHYEGIFEFEGEHYPVSGIGSFEFSRSATPHSLIPQALAITEKIPVNFMTYQVLNLDAQRQVIFYKVDIAGKPMSYRAYIRHKGGFSEVYNNVQFNILDYQDTPILSPFGQYTLLPKNFEWQIFNNEGEQYLHVQAEVDTEFKYGLGLGYSAAFQFEAYSVEGRQSGRGYIEYIDVVEQTEICPYPEDVTASIQYQQSITMI